MTQIKPLYPHPALILQQNGQRALVIADLHIGWEKLLIQKGVHIPSQTTKIRDRLLKLVKQTKPTHLIVLGDVKDAITKVSSEEWREIPKFFEELQKSVGRIQVVLGNHDGNLEALLPENVEIMPSSGATFGDVGLFHGHAWPIPDILGCKSLITGHVHPTIAIRDPMGFRVTRQVLVKTACNKEKLAKALLKYLDVKHKNDVSDTFCERFKVKLEVSELFILPSFNQFLGGRAINEKKKQKKSESYIGPILRSGCANMDEAEVFLLDGTFLGTVEHLKKLS